MVIPAIENWVSVIEALPDLQGELEMTTNPNIRQRTADEPMRTITSKTAGQTRIVSRRRKKGEKPQSYSPKRPAHTITQVNHIIERKILSNSQGFSQSQSRRARSVDRDIGEPIKTINNNQPVIRQDDGTECFRIRSLTLEETMILQGFPSTYQIPYKKKVDAWVMVGNAVCPPLAKAIVEGIL